MKQFWIFRKNGTSYIEDAQDVTDLYIPKNSKVEEHSTYNEKKVLSLEEEQYYEKFFTMDDVVKDIDRNLVKVDRLLDCQNILSKWEQNFIFGIKKKFNNRISISKKQEESLNNIYVKKYTNVA